MNLARGFLQVENGKTKSSNRKIWLPEKVEKILRTRLERFKGDLIFPHHDIDGAGAAYNLFFHHHEVLTELKFKFRIYDLRHTFATRQLEAGTDLLTLASMLGHSGLGEITRYAHPSEERKSEAFKSLAKRRAKAV